MGIVERRPGPNGGKADVLREETGMCTSGAAGVEVHARRDGGAETTSGRSSSQQGLTATCTDLVSEGHTEARGGWRTGAGARRSDEGGGTPADVIRVITTREVTPRSCKGALGTWQFQAYPDMLGRGTMERPWKQTIPRRGVCESALKLRAVWEGDRREAKVRTGLGKSHRPGS
jgi:hypothetical protein